MSRSTVSRHLQSGGLSAGIVVPEGQPSAGSRPGERRRRVRRAGEIGFPSGTEIDDLAVQPSRSNGRPRRSCWLNRADRMTAALSLLAALRAPDDVTWTTLASTVGSTPFQKSRARLDAKCTSPES